MFKLKSEFKPAGHQPHAIKKIVHGLRQQKKQQTLLGVTGSGKTFVMAGIINKARRPALVLAPNKTLAAQLYGELRAFFPDNAVEYFVSYYDYYQPEAYVPSSDTYIQKDASINSHIEQMRLSATKALLEREDAVIVATVSAIYGLGDPKVYSNMVLEFKMGNNISQRQVIHHLVALQYQRSPLELRRGSYRVHGDVIDIFPAESEHQAIRVELFDDTVESIAAFDPLTGERIKNLEQATIHPTTHYVTDKDTIVRAIESIKQELKQHLATLYQQNKLVEAQRLEQRTRFDLEMMEQLGYCTGIENYSRHLSGRATGDPPPTLFEYLPGNALLFIDESHVTIPQLRGMYLGDRARKENLVTYGFRLPSALDNRPLRFDEFERLMPQTVFVSATPGPYENEHAEVITELLVRPTGLLDPKVEIRPVQSQVDDLLSEINHAVKKAHRVLVTTLTKRMSEDLTDYLAEHNVKVKYLHSDIDTVERTEIIRDLRLKKIDVLVGINLLREGLDIPEVALVAILDADKEGFLRSETTLIQTMGRAARNVDGKVILYADKITGSIQRAVDETSRRRGVQETFNQEHHITPKSISTKVHDIMQIKTETKRNARKSSKQIATITDRASLEKEIESLEKQMYQYAKNLEFETAAKTRDSIKILQQQLLEAH